jgi:hypothetical protein
MLISDEELFFIALKLRNPLKNPDSQEDVQENERKFKAQTQGNARKARKSERNSRDFQFSGLADAGGQAGRLEVTPQTFGIA